MAGRPINPEEREKKTREVNTAIESLQKRGIPVTRQSLANELGIRVQNFYKGTNGELSYIAQYVEALGVLEKRFVSHPIDVEMELKSLKDENMRIKKDNARLREKDKLSKATIKSKDEMIDALNIKLETLRGDKFVAQKHKFINSRL